MKYVLGIEFSEIGFSWLSYEEVCNESELLTCKVMELHSCDQGLCGKNVSICVAEHE